MKQNNSTEVSGSSFRNIPNKKNLRTGKNMNIQIIGNPRNTKKWIFPGRSGFLNIYPEIFYIIAFSTFAFKF